MFAAFKFSLDYVTSAQVDQSASVMSSRGQVAYSLRGSDEKTLLGARSDLGVGTVLWLDRNTATSADLQLFDDTQLKLLGGSTLELTRMEVGRFINQHSVLLTQDSGPIQYATGDAVDVQVPGALVHLGSHGDYTVWLDGDTTRVLVYTGEARVAPSVGGAVASNTVSVNDNHRIEIDPKGQMSAVMDLPTDLLANTDFVQHDQGWQALDVPNSALDVNGTRSWVPGPEDTGTGSARGPPVRQAGARRDRPRPAAGYRRFGLPPPLAASLGARRLRRPVGWRLLWDRVPDDVPPEVRGPRKWLVQPVGDRLLLREP